MDRVDVQKTAEQQELMEVVDSPPERAFTLLEPMETGGEEKQRSFYLENRVKLRHHSVQASWKS